MKKQIVGLGALLLVAGQASAGTVNVVNTSAYNNTSSMESAFLAAHPAVSSAELRSHHIAGLFGPDTMNFNAHYLNGAFQVGVESAGDYFLGTAQELINTNSGDYFNAGSNVPANSELVLAFGNTEFSAESVTLNFVPNEVASFGFNFDDIEVSELIVTFMDNAGNSEEVSLPSISAAEGFLWMVAAQNQTIASITLTQDPGTANDGFSFYGFQTIAVAPVPGAAFAGFGLLGGLGVIRTVRRRK